MTTSHPATSPLRGREREAQSNDVSILRAAREIFFEYGWGAPMSQIATRAGIGVASIYRRYPSKMALVDELRVRSLEHVIELADACAQTAREHGKPDSAMELFLRRMIVEASVPLAPTVGRHVETTPKIDALSIQLEAALERVLEIDRRLGLIPTYYSPADLLLTLTHLRPNLAISRERANEIHLRELHYVLIGLRAVATAGIEPEGKKSSWQEWLQINSTNAG